MLILLLGTDLIIAFFIAKALFPYIQFAKEKFEFYLDMIEKRGEERFYDYMIRYFETNNMNSMANVYRKLKEIFKK